MKSIIDPHGKFWLLFKTTTNIVTLQMIMKERHWNQLIRSKECAINCLQSSLYLSAQVHSLSNLMTRIGQRLGALMKGYLENIFLDWGSYTEEIVLILVTDSRNPYACRTDKKCCSNLLKTHMWQINSSWIPSFQGTMATLFTTIFSACVGFRYRFSACFMTKLFIRPQTCFCSVNIQQGLSQKSEWNLDSFIRQPLKRNRLHPVLSYLENPIRVINHWYRTTCDIPGKFQNPFVDYNGVSWVSNLQSELFHKKKSWQPHSHAFKWTSLWVFTVPSKFQTKFRS